MACSELWGRSLPDIIAHEKDPTFVSLMRFMAMFMVYAERTCLLEYVITKLEATFEIFLYDH